MASRRSPSKATRVGSSRSPEERVGRGQTHFHKSSHNRRRREPRVGARLLRDYPKFTPNATYTVIVKRLPLAISEHQLSSVFGRLGPVSETKIIRTPTPTNNVYGLVNYVYFNDSKKAVTQLNGTVINGSQISVEFARTDAYHQKSHGNTVIHAGEVRPNPQQSEGHLLAEKTRYFTRHGVLLNQPIPRSMIDKFNSMKAPFELNSQSKYPLHINNPASTTKSPFSDSCTRDSGYISVGTNIGRGGINARSSSSTSSSPVPTLRGTTNIKMDSKSGILFPTDSARVDNETEEDLPPLECPELDSCDAQHGSLGDENHVPLLDCCHGDYDQEDMCVDDDMPPLESHHSDSGGSSMFQDFDSDVPSEDDDTFLSGPSLPQTSLNPSISNDVARLTSKPPNRCTQSSPILELQNNELSSGNNITLLDPLSMNTPHPLSYNIATKFSSITHDRSTMATPSSLTSNDVTLNHLPSSTQTTPLHKIGRGKMLLDLLQQMPNRSPRTPTPSFEPSNDMHNDTTPVFEMVGDIHQTAGRVSRPQMEKLREVRPVEVSVTAVHSEEREHSEITNRETPVRDNSIHGAIKSEPITVPISNNSLASPLLSSLLADSSSIQPSTSPEEQPPPIEKVPTSVNRGLSSSVSQVQQQQWQPFCVASSKSLGTWEDGVSSSEEDEVEYWGTRFGRGKDEMERSISTLERNIHRWQAELKRLQQKNIAMTKELEEAQHEEVQTEVHPDLIGELPPERLREFDRISELEARLVLTRESNTSREVCQKQILQKAQERYKKDKLALLELELAVKGEEVKWYLELAKLENKMLQVKADFYINF